MEVLKQARPSILFLASDGGRTPQEMNQILESRKVMEEIDWECEVHKLYMDENQGMYRFSKLVSEYIWERVDRCIFLEDDYVPAVSFFRFCAELLEKYKDDLRIEMICGFNPLGIYAEADQGQDYFFTENGWAIWGTAYWKRTAKEREFPLPYRNDPYISKCLVDNLSEFWVPKAKGYLKGELVDGHVPGGEFFHCVNSVLNHRLSIVPSKNLISNIGVNGTHFNYHLMTKKQKKLFDSPVYELNEEIRHPKYVIDDKHYSNLYEDAVGHKKLGFFEKIKSGIYGRLWHLKNGTYFKHYIYSRYIHKTTHREK